MSVYEVAGLIGIGVIAAVLLILCGYWLAGEVESCDDCRRRDPRNHADPYGGQPEPDHGYLEVERPVTAEQAKQIEQRWREHWAPEDKVFRTGPAGRVLHKAGCVHLVRPEQVDQADETHRYCRRCWPAAA